MRSLKRMWSVALVAALALTLAACSDDDNKPKDAGTDATTKQDGNVPPPTKLTCNNDCKDFVMDSLTFPDANTAAQIGVDYNNDGAVDNALGSILGALSGITSSLDLQKSIDNALYRGKTIMLTRMQASSWTTEPKAAAQAWVGQNMACCTSTDDAKCKTEAKAGCFAGGYTFYPDMTKSDPKAIFGGSITSGAFKFGSTASSMSLSLPITDAGTLKLNLKGVFMMGNVDSTGTKLTNGILAGVVTKDDLDNSLIPEITNMLNTTLKDPTVDSSTKDTIKTLFDTNPADGTIDVKEVAENALIKTFLAGDVDVDGDGKMELSLGISFTGTSAKIDEQGTAPDAGPTPDTGAADAGADAPTGD